MYGGTPAYRVGQEVQFGLRRQRVFPHRTDGEVVVTEGVRSRLDLLSDQAYQTPELWWVIAEVNNLVDPLGPLAVGSRLRIPSRARLASLQIV